MNIIKTVFDWLSESIFGADPIKVIQDSQSRIVRVNAKAAEKVTMAALDIEEAVDFQIDCIRASVNAAFGQIEPLLATGAVHTAGAKALKDARVQIEKALTTLDAAL